MNKLLLLLVAFLLILPVAYSLGIGPAKIQIDFEPGKDYTNSFIVVNEADVGKTVDLYVTGDTEAVKYFNLSETQATLKPKETRGFTFTANFPENLTPGQHKVRVGAVEHVGAGGQVSARVGVELFVLVEVPIPGKYITVDSFEVSSTNAGQPAQLNLKITNRGKETINQINAAIDIFDANRKKAATVILTDSNLAPQNSKVLSTEIKTSGFIAGKYIAKADILYDDFKTSAEANFRVGDLLVNVLRVYGEDVNKDSIGKILIDFESQWSETIRNIRPEITISKTGQIISQTQGSEFSVEPFTAGTTTVFWDTRGQEAGEYDVKATLSYENKTSEGIGKIKIVSFEMTWMLAALFVIIALLSLRVFFKKRRSG